MASGQNMFFMQTSLINPDLLYTYKAASLQKEEDICFHMENKHLVINRGTGKFTKQF